MTNPATWIEILTLLSPAGQDQLVAFIQKAKEERGAQWIPHIKEQFPLASWIIELVCTMNAEDAFAELQAAYPNYPLWMAKSKITALHGKLLTEIERKR